MTLALVMALALVRVGWEASALVMAPAPALIRLVTFFRIMALISTLVMVTTLVLVMGMLMATVLVMVLPLNRRG